MLNFHPEAKKKFNKKTEEFIDLFKSYNPLPQKEEISEEYVSAHLTEKDLINPIKYHYISNEIGENISLVTYDQTTQYIIEKSDYMQITMLIDKLSNIKEINALLSFKYIENKLSDWLVARKNNEFDTDFITFLTSNATEDIKPREVWIPIPFTTATKTFSFGQINFKIITENIIRNWFEPKEEIPEKKDKKKEVEKEDFIEMLRKDFQGFIAGVIKITAEPEKAKEIAFQKVSDVISFLRLFSPAIFHPQLIVGAYEYGWNNYESEKCIIFTEEKKGTSFKTSEMTRDKGLRWKINDPILNFINAPENENFNLLLKLENKSNFQEDIYNSILIYSRHSLKRDLSDKIMYILVALESILLKNETEPIQQNLADRIAYMIDKTPEGRQLIVRKIKDIYQIRSQFIHHGKPSLESIDKIKEFFKISWDVITLLVANMNRFETKFAFLAEIDKIKYS